MWIDPGYGVPGIPAPRMPAGLALSAIPSLLCVGTPYGPAEERPATGAAFGATVR